MTFKHHPVLYTWIVAFVNSAVPIFLIPFAFKNLSQNEYTLYLYLSMLMNLSFVADIGFTSTITRFYSYANSGVGDTSYNRSSLFRASEFFYVILGLFGVLIFLGFMMFSGQGVTSGLEKSVKISSSILFGSIIFIRFNGFKYISLLNGTNLIQKTKQNELISSLATLALGIFSIIYFKKIEYFIGSQLVGFTLNLVLNKLMAKKLNLLPSLNSFNIDSIKKIFVLIWSPALKIGLVALAGVFTANALNIVIGRLTDKILVSQYLLSIRLFSFVISFLSISITTFFPKIVNWLVLKKNQELQRLLISLVSFSTLVFLVSFLGIAILSLKLHWLNFLFLNVLPIEYIVLLGLVFFMELHQSLHAAFYVQTNDVPFVIPMIITSLVILTAGYFLAPSNRLVEMICMQIVVAGAFNSWFSVKLNLRLVNLSFKNYIFQVFQSIGNFRFLKVMFERDNV